MEILLSRRSVAHAAKGTRKSRDAGRWPENVFVLMSLPPCHHGCYSTDTSWGIWKTKQHWPHKISMPSLPPPPNASDLCFHNGTRWNWVTVKKKNKKQPTKPNKTNISLFLLIPPNIRHKKEFFQQLKLQDQVLQLQHQLEVQRQNCLLVRKITLPIKHASSVPLNYAVIPTELTFLQKLLAQINATELNSL